MRRQGSQTLLCFENINYGASSSCEEEEDGEDVFQTPSPVLHSDYEIPKDISSNNLSRKISDLFKTDGKDKIIFEKMSPTLRRPLIASAASDGTGRKRRLSFFQNDKKDKTEEAVSIIMNIVNVL